ncbi:MAG: hypothetical protein H7Y59_04635 [Anaerolineales bacterium]|nr:hypothetical protein [Anaerolineales bacterium]
MITQERINHIVSEISSTKQEEIANLPLEIVNIIAKEIDAKCVEMYFVDSDKALAMRHAGSGELGKRFDKYNRTRNLKVHNEFGGQVGPSIVLGEVRVVDWDLGKLISYPLLLKPLNSYSESRQEIIIDTRPMYESPDFASMQDIYLLIRSDENNIGALCMYFDNTVATTDKEILLLQGIADFIGDFVK